MGQVGSKQEMFWEACGFGRAHLVQKFIEHGIDVNWVSSVHACSPIHVASQGKPEVVQLLLDAGCDLSVVDSRGNTAVHHAAIQGHASIIQMLADAGADMNVQDKNGWTPLHCAAYYGHQLAVQVLLRNKSDIHLLNKDGRSALVETARSKHDDDRVLGNIARALIKAGSDVDLKCADLGEANFTGLMFAAYHNHLDVARAFMEGSCNLDSASCYTKWTALHWAADCGNTEMVSLLLAAGADPTRTGMRGELAGDRAKDRQIKVILDNAVKSWKKSDRFQTSSSLSSAHSFNAQASLDTARALETLYCRDKNRAFLSVSMPTIPALGISSRSDPQIRYRKRSVSEVAIKNLSSVLPWRSYTKQGCPSPDEVTDNDSGKRRFPSHNDKTNALAETVAQRISYMTNKVMTMKDGTVRQSSLASKDNLQPKRGSDQARDDSFISAGDNRKDSALSALDGSEISSESPSADGVLTEGDLKSSACPEVFRSSSSFKINSAPKQDIRDGRVDARIIEASHRGFSILHALQERHRRIMYPEIVAVHAVPARDMVSKYDIMTQV